MKIAIYGVSRSGKDYLIKDLIKYLDKSNINLYQIYGSNTLNDLSLKNFKSEFKLLSEINKDLIRKEFIKYVNELEKKHGNIIVDGHYSFYNEDMSFRKVFTEDDLNCYDLFFYLDTNSQDIFSRMRMSDGEKKNNVYTVEDIINWKNYEVDNMTDDLIRAEKELHIIKYENSEALEYIYHTIMGKYNSKRIASELISKLNLDSFNSAILVDCDKTLIYEDTTATIFKSRNLDYTPIRRIYEYDRYSNYQAVVAKKYYESINIFDGDYDYVLNNIHFNYDLIEDLKGKTSSIVIAITGGEHNLWHFLLQSAGVNATVLEAGLIMSKYTKYFVLKKLQELGKYVICIGDSMLDSLMLKHANKAYIIANKGIRNNIEKFLFNNRHIHQLAYSKYLYSDLITDSSIGSIKCLNLDLEEIRSKVEICKSSSEVEGKKLRDAHYQLGIEVAKLIQKDYLNELFVVIIIMRSGLCFGQGIMDYFDCPVLFYEESNTLKFDTEFYFNKMYKDRNIILVDGVINSGKSMKQLVAKMQGYKTIIATNVISSKFNLDYIHPIYATRISGNSFTGAKQRIVLDGKGPDTSDRLFRNL